MGSLPGRGSHLNKKINTNYQMNNERIHELEAEIHGLKRQLRALEEAASAWLSQLDQAIQEKRKEAE